MLINEVWGPPSWRRERRRLARAGGGGAAAGGLGEIFSGCGGCDGCSGLDIGGGLGEILGAILVVIAVALVAMLVVWLVYKLIAYVHAKRNELRPNGALLPPVRRMSARRVRGTVLESKELGQNPITGDACVGWAAELSSKRWFAHHVMLRDGESYGFDVELADGEVVRVPAGRLRLDRGGDEERPEYLDGYLATVDPQHDRDALEPAIPFDSASVVTVRPGDKIELAGELHRAPDPDAGETYRGAAAMVLVPTETIAIRRS